MTALSVADARELAVEQDRLRGEWAAVNGLALADPAPLDPIAWLLGRRDPSPGAPAAWLTHASCWTAAAVPFAIVAQPYSLTDSDLRELAQLQRVGLTVTVDTGPSWHAPGLALTVTVSTSPLGGLEC